MSAQFKCAIIRTAHFERLKSLHFLLIQCPNILNLIDHSHVQYVYSWIVSILESSYGRDCAIARLKLLPKRIRISS